jgi:hypothetical protein
MPGAEAKKASPPSSGPAADCPPGSATECKQPAVAKRASESRLKTKRNEAFFWSGIEASVASEMAAAKGGYTLESFMHAHGVESPDPSDPDALKKWEALSREFAENASGEVGVFMNPDRSKPNSVWNRIELPALENNPNVTKVTQTDVTTGKETVLFERKTT